MRYVMLMATIACTAMTAAGGAKPATHAVAIEATSFQPRAITVKMGDTVVWTNKDPFPHTATSKEAGFDSQSLAPGASFKFVPRKRGEFTYVCTLHPTMTATLTVK